jgi:hypothetical protein
VRLVISLLFFSPPLIKERGKVSLEDLVSLREASLDKWAGYW